MKLSFTLVFYFSLNQIKHFCILLILLSLPFLSFTQTLGSIDESFNKDDKGFDNKFGANDQVRSIVLQNDKIIIGGRFTSYNQVTKNYLARLNTDGTLDNSFRSEEGPDGALYAISKQPDGKILIGGIFTMYNNTKSNSIARLNEDGTLDTTFLAAIKPGYVGSIVIQDNGKIIIGGRFRSKDTTKITRLTRLNVDGSIDDSFNSEIGEKIYDSHRYSTVESIALQSDGKIIIGGFMNIPYFNNVGRLNVDGSIDYSFNYKGYHYVNSIVVQSDKKILVGRGDDQSIARLNEDGSYDNTFNAKVYGTVNSIVFDKDGKIFIGGRFNRNYNILRLHNNGKEDTTFEVSPNGLTENFALALQEDGKIVIGGEPYAREEIPYDDLSITRLNSDGSEDFDFTPTMGANWTVREMAEQQDGKILITGGFTSYNGKSSSRILRLNEDGTRDNSFDPGTGPKGSIKRIVLQPNGYILLAGNFSRLDGRPFSHLVRLKPNGSLDERFKPIFHEFDEISSIAVRPNGKIIIAGSFREGQGESLRQLNEDGSIDNSFTWINNKYAYIYSVAIQPDGKILVGGTIPGYPQEVYFERLNEDGSIDTSFNFNLYSAVSVKSIVLQKDGKITIDGYRRGPNDGSGYYYDHNFIRVYFRNRLNSNGTIDESFKTSFNSDEDLKLIGLEPDGKIILADNVRNRYNETFSRKILCLNSDGSLDTTFTTGTGANDKINSVLIQKDGRILLGGTFTSYNGIGRNRIARLYGSTYIKREKLTLNENTVTVYPNPTVGEINISFNNLYSEKLSANLLTLDGKPLFNFIGEQSELPIILSNFISNVPPGLYFLQLQSEKESYTIKVVKN